MVESVRQMNEKRAWPIEDFSLPKYAARTYEFFSNDFANQQAAFALACYRNFFVRGNIELSSSRVVKVDPAAPGIDRLDALAERFEAKRIG